MQLCPNSFAVLWQGQPQSTSSCVGFLETVEMVLFGRPATTGRLCTGADQLGQSQVGLHEEAFPSVHRVVMLSGNVSLHAFWFPISWGFLACCSYGKLNIGLENVWAVGNNSSSRSKQTKPALLILLIPAGIGEPSLGMLVTLFTLVLPNQALGFFPLGVLVVYVCLFCSWDFLCGFCSFSPYFLPKLQFLKWRGDLEHCPSY